MRTTVLTVVVVLAAALAGCALPGAEVGKPKITIAIQPTDNAASIQDKATELESFLEARTGADVEILIPMSNAGVIQSLAFGHADAALMGAWPAQLAVERAGAEIVLAEKREVTIGSETVFAPYYYSYYVVKPDSGFTNLTQLAGKRVAYTSPTSTSGYVYPVAKLVGLGLVPAPAAGKEADPKAFFGEVHMAGGYRQAWEALKHDQADVAVIAGDVSRSLYDEVLGNTTTIATQGPVPSHAVVFGKHLQGELREKLLAALLELKGEHKDLMRKLVSGIFVEFVATTSEEHTGPLGDALGLVGFRLTEKV